MGKIAAYKNQITVCVIGNAAADLSFAGTTSNEDQLNFWVIMPNMGFYIGIV